MTDAELLQKLEEIFRENFDDGTITLTPAVVRSALEDALRATPGYMEALERDAADPSRDVSLDWRNL